MKKFTLQAISLLLVLTLCGCSTGAAPGNTAAASTPAAAPVATPAPTPEPSPAAAVTSDGWPVDFSLCEAYKDYFLLGTIYTDASRVGSDNALTLKQFNVITPENIMKPENVQPTEGNVQQRDRDIGIGRVDLKLRFRQWQGLSARISWRVSWQRVLPISRAV